MNIKKIKEADKIIIVIDGRLDTITAQPFLDELLLVLPETKQVEIDCSGLEYISSAGLRSLLLGKKTAAANNGSIKLINVSQEIKEIFNITGFNNVLTIL